MTLAVIDQIAIGERGRTDLGEIAELAASIKAIGLLHPVVVTAGMELVAGERRLKAMKSLGWTEVPITVVDLDNAADVLRAELEENTCRKSLSAYEAAAMRRSIADALAPEAKQNQGQPGRDRSSKLEERSRIGSVRKAAAVGTGFSGSTLDKVDVITDAAERGVVKQGKQEFPAPAPVVEVARVAAEKVKETGAAIDREFQRVTEAIDTYVAQDEDVRRAKLRRRFFAALGQVREVTTFDAMNIGTVLDRDEWDDLSRLHRDLNEWFETCRQARGPLLKLAGGTDA